MHKSLAGRTATQNLARLMDPKYNVFKLFERMNAERTSTMPSIVKVLEYHSIISWIYYRFCRKGIKIWLLFPFKVLEFFLGTRIRSKYFHKILIRTYDGLGQTVHPDVIKAEGLYVMAVNPYPFSDECYENPCIYISDNSMEFEPIGRNPVFFPTSLAPRTHLSDPAICLKDQTYYLFFRECRYFAASDQNRTIIYRSSSLDLVNWSKPEEFVNTQLDIISPSVIFDGSNMLVYYVGTESNKTCLARFSESEGFENSKILSVHRIPPNYMIWHIDVVQKEGVFIGLFALSQGLGGKDTDRLFLAISHDGYSWELQKEIRIEDVPRAKIRTMYKSSLVLGENGIDDLFISVQLHDRRWFTYVMRNFNYEEYIS